VRHPVVAAALAGMRQNLLPGVVLWSVALGIVLMYWSVPALRPAYDRIAAWKIEGGYAFSAGISAIAGGVVPWLALIAMGRLPRRRCAVGAFLVLFWVYRGLEVDALYRFQSWAFGDGTDVATVLTKVAVDMFGYSLFWAGPSSLIAYRWQENGFSWARLRASLDRRVFTVLMPSLALSQMATWLPAVAIIYSLPPALQVPLYAVVLCFWVLLIEAVAARRVEAAPAPVVVPTPGRSDHSAGSQGSGAHACGTPSSMQTLKRVAPLASIAAR